MNRYRAMAIKLIDQREEELILIATKMLKEEFGTEIDGLEKENEKLKAMLKELQWEHCDPDYGYQGECICCFEKHNEKAANRGHASDCELDALL